MKKRRVMETAWMKFWAMAYIFLALQRKSEELEAKFYVQCVLTYYIFQKA